MPGIGQLLSQDDIRRCFLFAKMTVQNELLDSNEYKKLHFVEFLDFMCRAAIAIELQPKDRNIFSASSQLKSSRAGRRASRMQSLELNKQPSVYALAAKLQDVVHELFQKIVDSRYAEELDTPETMAFVEPDSESDSDQDNSESD